MALIAKLAESRATPNFPSECTMTNLILTTSLVVIVPFAYGFTLRRFAETAQPSRLRMAEIGEELLSEGLPAEEEAMIQFGLDQAFNPWLTFIASLLMPIAMILAAVEVVRGRTAPRALVGGTKRLEFEKLAMWSAFAANPLFGVVVAIELAIGILVLVWFTGQEAILRSLIKRTVRSIEAIPTWRRTMPHGA